MEKLRASLVTTILELTKLGALEGYVLVSTKELAKRVGRSQQAVSLHLLDLERIGFIERRKSGHKTGVKLTAEGREAVHSLYSELKAALEEKGREITFHGRLFQGLGEGAYYIGLRGYTRQFIKLLDFEPFPGTLNLKLTSPLEIEQKRQLRYTKGLQIQGFENGTRTYGGAKCFRARLNGKHPGALILIDRTHYDDSVLEVISPVNVRKELGLTNGDEVSVTVTVNG